ncbi:hypothetical protein MXAZACID_13446 [Acidocella sp. MX-AZ02]|nr:hypothetical protein MXAZACID_13446 [Acidocella sp. MX-AZ02]
MNAQLAASLEQLRAVSPDDFDGLHEIETRWSILAGEDESVVPDLYRLYMDTLRGWFGAAPAAIGFTGLDAYKFVISFCGLARFPSHGAKARASAGLAAIHAEHLALLTAGLDRPDELISAVHLRTRTGCWSDVLAAMFELYYWRRPLDYERDPIFGEVAALLPRFYRAFPDRSDRPLSHLLEAHPRYVESVVDLIRFYLLERGQGHSGPIGDFFDEMLGQTPFTTPLRIQNAEILKAVLHDAGSWPQDRLRLFIETAVLEPLNIRPVSQAERLEALDRDIAVAIHRLNVGKDRAPPAAESNIETRFLRQSEAERHLVETDFTEWARRRHDAGVQALAVSTAARRAVKTICAKLPAKCRPELQTLLGEADAWARRPKRFPMPAPAENRFRDFGLKLLVIEELMYRQKRLLPVFDLASFAAEYTKREISVEEDGYAIIPEVARYFKNLPIPEDALACVETLHQSSGLDGGARVMAQLFPFWDPGSGDEPIAVSAKAIEDLALLPNLTRISGLENSRPSQRLLRALRDKGVALVREEDR